MNKQFKNIEEPVELNELRIMRFDIRSFEIKIEKFYYFFTSLMNCLPIFYEDEFISNYTIRNITPNDDDLCAICIERKPDVLLKCKV